MTKLTNYYFTSSSQLKVKLISWFVHSNSTHLQTEPAREILGLRREKGISIRKWAELTTYVTDAQGCTHLHKEMHMMIITENDLKSFGAQVSIHILCK